jgi:hypothetical protein
LTIGLTIFIFSAGRFTCLASVGCHPPFSSLLFFTHKSTLLNVAKNGAQEYLVKSHLSGDNLDWAIEKAMFAVAFNAHVS